MNERPAWVEVDLDAIASNIRSLKVMAEPSRLCAVVKADAYGHGVLPVARTALESGADCLAVALPEEGLELREAGVSSDILVLGPSPDQAAEASVQAGLISTVFTEASGRAFSQAARDNGKPARVHLKIDTGMNRVGAEPSEAPELAQRLAALPGISIEGVFSHFATADDEDLSFARSQLELFLRAVDRVEKALGRRLLRHMANSAGLIAIPESRLDLVRAGIAVYGLSPRAGMNLRGLELRPAMSLKARASHVKDIPAEVSVSYGRRWFSQRPSRIATLPLGYADGYSRLLTNKASVGLRGSLRAPQVGTICMDQFMVDVTEQPEVGAGEEFTLFGPGGPSVDELAALLGTINYEITCMMGKRLPRVYKGGRP